jgi:hypothetical protein
MNKLSLIFIAATAFPFAAILSAAQTQGQAAPATGATTPAATTPASSGGVVGGGGNAVAGPAPSVDSVFANNDLNKDGIITKAEATASGKRMILQWDLYDANKDNKADKAEVTNGLAAAGALSTAASTSSRPNNAPATRPPTASPSSSEAANGASTKPTTTTPASK